MENYLMVIKMIFINMSTSYTIIKINNYKNVSLLQKKILFVANILFALIYTFLRRNLKLLLAFIICYYLFFVVISTIMKLNILHGWIGNIISISISLIAMFISTIINFALYKIIYKNLEDETILEYLTIGIIQFVLIYLFFRIKRFKNGFSFLKRIEKENEMNSNKLGIIISFTIVLISLSISSYSRFVSKILITILIIGGILMFDWIKKSITKYYKEKMKERTVEIQQEQIKEKDETIKNLKTELETVLQINHKYSQRISAMEKAVSKLAPTLQTNEEFAEEYGDILSYINELSKEYKEEVALTIKENKLPKTNVFSIDNLLEYMKQEAEKEKIDFDLELKFNINEIIENKIAKNKLETILTDHIRDAIIAIKSSENKNRKIKVIFNKEENYQIEFYDTGIEFEIDTLLKLGLERTTTHKATGGTGIGFITTFETLKECKASLIIKEFNNKQYTKAIIIKFDNKNEYKIHSYRAEEIKNKTKNNRIKIYKIN